MDVDLQKRKSMDPRLREDDDRWFVVIWMHGISGDRNDEARACGAGFVSDRGVVYTR